MRKTSIDLEQHQYRLADRAVEEGYADNQSEAFRRLVDAGGVQLELSYGASPESTLKQALLKFRDGFLYLSLVLLGITLVLPLNPLRVLALPILCLMATEIAIHTESQFGPRLINLWEEVTA